MVDEWDCGWDLSQSDYPSLPKALTNKASAKKRKHKELIITEEQLARPVKLGVRSNSVALGHREADATAEGESQQQKKSKGGAEQQSVGAKAAHKEEHAKHQGPARQSPASKSNGDVNAAAPAKHAGSAAQAGGKVQKSKNRFRQQVGYPVPGKQQQAGKHTYADSSIQEQHTSVAAAGATATAKSSRNKFKQLPSGTASGTAPSAAASKGATGAGEAPIRVLKARKQQQRQQEQQEQQHADGQESLASSRKHKAQPAQRTKLEGKPHHPSAQQHTCIVRLTDAQQHKEQQQEGGQQVPKKRSKDKQQDTPCGDAAAAAAPAAGLDSGLGQAKPRSKLLDKMRVRLQGGQFRQLNEVLYTRPGDEAFALMQQQPQLFDAYHSGFQQQTRGWPVQPLDVAMHWLHQKPKELVVADLGCGDARLAASVQQKVHSLDLVSTAPGVVACNMAATPLAPASVDVAVFSLSLMGTDYGSFLIEAHRVLRPGGWLWIAEVRSRFAKGGDSDKEDLRPFIACLQRLGFKLHSQDASNRMFLILVLRKDKHGGGGAAADKQLQWPELKACVYKKR